MEELKATKEELVEFNSRLEKVRERMCEEKVDLMILSNMEHIFYLSNYQTVGGCVQVLSLSLSLSI